MGALPVHGIVGTAGSKADVLEWRTTKVASVHRASDHNVVLRLALATPGSLRFEAGQWVYVRDPRDPELRGAYSIASPPHERDHIDLCVKKVAGGRASTWMYDREPGDSVELSKALGTFRFRTPTGVPTVFFATGTGIAPIRSLLLDRVHQRDGRPSWLYYGVGREVNLVYHDEFLQLARTHPGFQYTPVVSRASTSWSGARGWVQEAFLHEFRGRKGYHAYVCGLRVMVDEVVRLLESEGLDEAAIHRERFD